MDRFATTVALIMLLSGAFDQLQRCPPQRREDIPSSDVLCDSPRPRVSAWNQNQRSPAYGFVFRAAAL